MSNEKFDNIDQAARGNAGEPGREEGKTKGGADVRSARQRFLERRRSLDRVRQKTEADPPAMKQRASAIEQLVAKLVEGRHKDLIDDFIPDLIRIRQQFQRDIREQIPSIDPDPLALGEDARPLSKAQFYNCSGEWLLCRDWHNANFQEVNFSQAVIAGSDLGGANLLYADLRGADCRGCDFEGADMSKAQVDGGTNFIGANLAGAKLPPNFQVTRNDLGI